MPDLWLDVDSALAEVPVNIMPLLDDTNFKSIETDVNYNAAGLTLIWHFITTAGAYSQTAVTPTDTGGDYDWVEQGNGLFTIEIPAAGGASINNDTEGFGWFTGVATGVLPWRGPVIGFRAAALNNALIDGGDLLDTNVTQWKGSAAPDNTGDAYARLGAPAGVSVSADIAAIEAQTDDIGAAGAGLTALPWNAAWDAEVESEATDALNAYDPPTNAEMEARTLVAASYFDPAADTVANVTTVGSVTGAVGSVTGAVGSVTGAVGSVAGNVGGNVTGSVGSVAAGGITAASIATGAIDADSIAADAGAEIADAVWDEALAGHVGAGSAGATLSAASAPTAAAVADAVWDEAIAGHAAVGRTGAALAAAGAAGDPWLTALPGAYAAGTAGDIIGNMVADVGALTPALAIASTTAASVSSGAIGIRTHHTLAQAITSTYAGNLAAATKLWLAIKLERDDADSASVAFIEKTAGLTVLAQAAYTTVAHGTLVVGGLAGAWTVTVGMDEVATGLLAPYAESMLRAECKALVGGATVALWDGVCDISRGIVQAVS